MRGMRRALYTKSKREESLLEVRRVGAAGAGGGFGLAREHFEQRADAIAQIAALDDHVDGAVREKKFGTLKTFRQLFAHRLRDHARAGETDECLGLRDDDIRHHRQTCRDAARRWVG